jgi:hypothetical protein
MPNSCLLSRQAERARRLARSINNPEVIAPSAGDGAGCDHIADQLVNDMAI